MKHWFVKWLEQEAEQVSQEKADEIKWWAILTNDMIKCGLEKQALQYYDAKHAIDPIRLPERPDPKGIFWTLESVMEPIKQEIDEDATFEQLEAVFLTVSELYYAGMGETALTYYLRAREMYPDLNLPEPEHNSRFN